MHICESFAIYCYAEGRKAGIVVISTVRSVRVKRNISIAFLRSPSLSCVRSKMKDSHRAQESSLIHRLNSLAAIHLPCLDHAVLLRRLRS